jgi:muramoyltetrapeptide carboxypeptidase
MSTKNILQIVCLSFLLATMEGVGQQKDTISRVASVEFLRPNYLQEGDTIAIVAPAGILVNKEEVMGKAKQILESWGLVVVFGENMYNQNHHFSGSDQERTADFQKALDNPNIKAILAARGGYGSVRVLDHLVLTKFRENPKWIIGYSDITAFHCYFHNLGFETLHAMMGTSFVDDPSDIKQALKTLKSALFGKKLSYKIPSSEFNKRGNATGSLVGGNISLLASMLGSESQISVDGKILFIEEIGEYKYSMDRMLQSLKRAGNFENCKGIIVGDVSRIKENTTLWGASIEELILNVFGEYDFPILFDFPAGHEMDNRALIFGRKIQLAVGGKKSTVDFAK